MSSKLVDRVITPDRNDLPCRDSSRRPSPHAGCLSPWWEARPAISCPALQLPEHPRGEPDNLPFLVVPEGSVRVHVVIKQPLDGFYDVGLILVIPHVPRPTRVLVSDKP